MGWLLLSTFHNRAVLSADAIARMRLLQCHRQCWCALPALRSVSSPSQMIHRIVRPLRLTTSSPVFVSQILTGDSERGEARSLCPTAQTWSCLACPSNSWRGVISYVFCVPMSSTGRKLVPMMAEDIINYRAQFRLSFHSTNPQSLHTRNWF